MTTSYKDYTNAVVTLLDFALNHCTHGSKAAARILLTAYNGCDWKVSAYDFNVLDRHYREAALAVIDGRCVHGTEPHYLVKNGGKHFTRLAEEMADENERLKHRKEGA